MLSTLSPSLPFLFYITSNREVMTMALLNDLTHKEHLLPTYYLRCEETNASGGRVCVGVFDADG